MAEEVILNKEGKEKLEQRLKYLKVVKSAEITERIKVAKEFGDLSENAEYDSAKNEEAMVAGEIAEIEYKLKRATIIKDTGKKDTVSIGSKIEIVEESETDVQVFEIVGTTEADVENNRISNESPIGNALLGHKVGETVNVKVPAGTIRLSIKKIF